MNLLSPYRKNRGIGLIEVLVTMIIIAIGLLGQASLMGVSSKANHAAYLRSHATMLSYDIIERLRVNRDLAVNLRFNTNYDEPASNYTGGDIQDVELKSWKTNVEQSLPSGEAEVTVTGNGTVTINIRWTEIAKGSESDNGNITPTVFSTQSSI